MEPVDRAHDFGNTSRLEGKGRVVEGGIVHAAGEDAEVAALARRLRVVRDFLGDRCEVLAGEDPVACLLGLLAGRRQVGLPRVARDGDEDVACVDALGLGEVRFPRGEELAQVGVVGGRIGLDVDLGQRLAGGELNLVEGDVGELDLFEVVADGEVELAVGDRRLSRQQLDQLLAEQITGEGLHEGPLAAEIILGEAVECLRVEAPLLIDEARARLDDPADLVLGHLQPEVRRRRPPAPAG